jgi:hypothetical protein
MNPYFEQAAYWLDFHTEFLSAVRRLLTPQVVPKYIVQLEEHIYIHDLPPEPRQRLGTADLSVAMSGGGTHAASALELIEAPAKVMLPEQTVEEVPYLEVRDRQGRELVTVIELLSPSNKRPGNDREAYLAKRRELLHSPAHLVEIDLLRGWPPMPQEGRPACDYSVLVSRAEKRPEADLWPVGLRDRLPKIPIPLRAPDEAARVDLQEAIHRAYDGPGYEHFIYSGEPEPPLVPADTAWARQIANAVSAIQG